MRVRAVVCLVVAFLFPAAGVRAGLVHQWSHAHGGTNDQFAGNVIADLVGNVIICGSFYNTITFDATHVAAGRRDLVVAKFDANGNPLWSHAMGDTLPDTGWDVAADVVGNVIVGASLAPNPDNRVATVIKYTPAGVQQWIKSFPSTSDSYAERVATDAAKNVYVAGSFSGTINFGGGPMVAQSDFDVFVVKLNASGNHLWSRHFTNGLEVGINALEVDPSGQAVVFGEFGSAIDLGAGVLNASGPADMYLVKFKTDGATLWSKRLGGSDYEGAVAMDINAAGDIALTGELYADADLGGGNLVVTNAPDVFLAKFTQSGTHVMSRCFAGMDNEYAGSVAFASNGDLLLTCNAYTGINLGDGMVFTQNQADLFVARFRDNGYVTWKTSYSGPGGVYGSIRDFEGDIILGGTVGSGVDFGGGNLSTGGDQDMFVARFAWSPETAVGTTPMPAVLGQNVPNPFNPRTTIPYTLAAPARVVIGVYDAAGTRVARLDQGARGAGSHVAEWNGRDGSGRAVASGVYFYRLEGMPAVTPRKMVLLK
jgi:hypothetical protein